MVLITYDTSPSVSLSSNPIKLTVCAWLQLLAVNVSTLVVLTAGTPVLAALPTNTPSVWSLLVIVNITS